MEIINSSKIKLLPNSELVIASLQTGGISVVKKENATNSGIVACNLLNSHLQLTEKNLEYLEEIKSEAKDTIKLFIITNTDYYNKEKGNEISLYQVNSNSMEEKNLTTIFAKEKPIVLSEIYCLYICENQKLNIIDKRNAHIIIFEEQLKKQLPEILKNITVEILANQIPSKNNIYDLKIQFNQNYTLHLIIKIADKINVLNTFYSEQPIESVYKFYNQESDNFLIDFNEISTLIAFHPLIEYIKKQLEKQEEKSTTYKTKLLKKINNL